VILELLVADSQFFANKIDIVLFLKENPILCLLAPILKRLLNLILNHLNFDSFLDGDHLVILFWFLLFLIFRSIRVRAIVINIGIKIICKLLEFRKSWGKLKKQRKFDKAFKIRMML
jgi:hypothetical protein